MDLKNHCYLDLHCGIKHYWNHLERRLRSALQEDTTLRDLSDVSQCFLKLNYFLCLENVHIGSFSSNEELFIHDLTFTCLKLFVSIVIVIVVQAPAEVVFRIRMLWWKSYIRLLYSSKLICSCFICPDGDTFCQFSCELCHVFFASWHKMKSATFRNRLSVFCVNYCLSM